MHSSRDSKTRAILLYGEGPQLQPWQGCERPQKTNSKEPSSSPIHPHLALFQAQHHSSLVERPFSSSLNWRGSSHISGWGVFCSCRKSHLCWSPTRRERKPPPGSLRRGFGRRLRWGKAIRIEPPRPLVRWWLHAYVRRKMFPVYCLGDRNIYTGSLWTWDHNYKPKLVSLLCHLWGPWPRVSIKRKQSRTVTENNQFSKLIKPQSSLAV